MSAPLRAAGDEPLPYWSTTEPSSVQARPDPARPVGVLLGGVRGQLDADARRRRG